MNILIVHNINSVLVWLVNEPLDSAPAHIANGYPELQAAWNADELTAVVIEVPEDEAYSSDLYEVINGEVVRKP